MKELSPGVTVSPSKIENAVKLPYSHFFVVDNARVVGYASLCVFNSPTGHKASVEDVVVLSSHRGKHSGRKLMEHIIAFSISEFVDVDLHLASNPTRIAANQLYRSLGFERQDTNAYKMVIKNGKAFAL